MTEQPTFEYRDEDGDDLIARPMRGIPAVLILTGTNGIAVDLDRVEEVVAGIRDAARTAAGRPAGPLTHAAAADAAAWAIAHEKAAARQTTGQDDTHPGYDLAGYPEIHAGPREKCPDPACEIDQHANCGAECSAVGQPAEAHDTDRAALRERLRLAIAQQYLDDTGSGRTVGELDDTEFGSLADAALKALTVEGER